MIEWKQIRDEERKIASLKSVSEARELMSEWQSSAFIDVMRIKTGEVKPDETFLEDIEIKMTFAEDAANKMFDLIQAIAK